MGGCYAHAAARTYCNVVAGKEERCGAEITIFDEITIFGQRASERQRLRLHGKC
jgi:hypothetical protein